MKEKGETLSKIEQGIIIFSYFISRHRIGNCVNLFYVYQIIRKCEIIIVNVILQFLNIIIIIMIKISTIAKCWLENILKKVVL